MILCKITDDNDASIMMTSIYARCFRYGVHKLCGKNPGGKRREKDRLEARQHSDKLSESVSYRVLTYDNNVVYGIFPKE